MFSQLEMEHLVHSECSLVSRVSHWVNPVFVFSGKTLYPHCLGRIQMKFELIGRNMLGLMAARRASVKHRTAVATKIHNKEFNVHTVKMLFKPIPYDYLVELSLPLSHHSKMHVASI